MKRQIQTILIAFALMIGIGGTAVAPAGAINVFGACGKNADTTVCKSTKSDKASTLIQTIVSLLLFATGTLSVIMIIVGGIKYTTSNGDSSKVTSGKNTILYAVVGLVVSLLAYVIVGFVLSQF